MKEKKQKSDSSIFSTIADFISTFITTIVVLIAAAFVIAMLMGVHAFTIESGSMSPKYPVNTLVFVKEVEADTIDTGDVVTYVMDSRGTLVTHRVIEVDRAAETFTTQGDANNTPDPSPVLWDNVVGKVILGIPGIGLVFRIFTMGGNRRIIIAAILILGGVSVVWDILKKRRVRENCELQEVQDEKK